MNVHVCLDDHGNVLVRNSRQLEPGRPCVRFTPGEWKRHLFDVNACQCELWKLEHATSPLTPETTPGNRR